MSLSELELRVLGALVEKEKTTPEVYPLSTNALLLACNQKTSRDPVSDYSVLEVEEALRSLAERGLTRSARGERAVKHQHRLAEAFELSNKELALLAVLMLRGPQTPGELRARSERYLPFADTAAVEASLARLAEHRPPLVKNHGRGPGQSQDRWSHTLGADPERLKPRVRQGAAPDAELGSGRARADHTPGDLRGEVAALRQDLGRLQAQVDRLLAHAGLVEEAR